MKSIYPNYSPGGATGHYLRTFLLLLSSFVGAFTASAQVFDTIAWTTAAPQPVRVNEAQAKTVGGKLYSFGGFDFTKPGFTPTKRAYVFDPSLNQWQPIADLPFTPNGTNFGGVTHAGIATNGTDIFIGSGYTANADGTGQTFGTRQVYRYNVGANTYTRLPDLPVAISAGQMECVNNRLHYLGGTNAARTEDLTTHYVLDLNNLAAGWSTLAPLPVGKHHAGSAVLNNQIYLIGGQEGHDAMLMARKDVHRYNPATNTWEQLADLPVPSGAMGRGHITSSVVVLNGRIIVLGGETVHKTGRTNMVSSYDPATNTWTNLTPLPQPRYSGVAGALGNKIYYSGGSEVATTFEGTPLVSGNLRYITPVADAFVRDGSFANTNYGTDTSLLVKMHTTANSGYNRKTYLRFDVGIPAANIVSARLRLFGKNDENTAPISVGVRGVNNDTWTENGINWKTAPAPNPGALSNNSVNSQAAYYEWDVTAFVKNQLLAGDNLISLQVDDTARQTKTLKFNSRENGANRPQLLITTDGNVAPGSGSILFTQSSQSVEVEQGSTQSLLEFLSTSDNTPMSVQLNAVDGNGGVPTWLSVNGKALENLPYTTGSEISFNFDATSLSIGKYTAKVTASAAGYEPAVLTIDLTVKAASSGSLTSLKVNFQDAATVPPTGWIRDFGQAFGPRTDANQGSGNTYGWRRKSDNTPLDLSRNGRRRSTPSDILLATVMHMQANDIAGTFSGTKIEGYWEAQVGNGNYDVTVSVGDATTLDYKASINIEGVPAIVNFVPSTDTRFKTATISVTVADGMLTVDATGGTNTKINYISIQPTTTKRPSVVRLNPESGSMNVSENTSVSTSILNLPNGGVNNATITSANVFLTELPAGTVIPANVNGTGGGDAITLVPTSPLKLNTTYQFTITDGVKDLSGASFIPYSSTFTTSSLGSGEVINARFEKVSLANVKGRHSSLTKGPDGKLYALTINGIIKRFPINSDGTLGTPELIYSLQDAYGTRQQRLAIGLAFDPASTASNLIAYVSHSSFMFLNGPEWDGKLTRLSGANLQNAQDVLVELPRSAKDHLTNSIAFGPDGALYFNQGSLSAMGRADQTWNNRDEALLSGAVLRLDVSKLGTLPLNVRTTADGGTYNPYASGAPLTIYASGVRNAYDLVWHSNGELYVPTNGSAAGGNTPVSVAGTLRPDGSTYSGPVIPALTNVQQTQKDFLFKVKQGGYYGHPNPKRGEYVLNGGNPTAAIDPAQTNAYPVGTLPDANYRGFAFDFQTNKSPNGVIEYRSNVFNGALKGRLMVVRYSQNDDIITLTPGTTNTDIVGYNEGSSIEGFSGFVDPLDLTEDTATGNIYVSEYGGDGTITLLRPSSPATPGGVITVNPARITDNDVSGGAAGTARSISIRNTGTQPVSLASISVAGANPDQVVLGELPAFPRTINAGDSLVITAAFNPTSTGLKTASIQVRTVDSTGVTASVAFRGLGTSGTGGTNEPSLQAILNLHEIGVSVGDDDPATNVINSNTTQQKAPRLGEELGIDRFVKAGNGNVTIRPLSVFGPTSSNPVTGMGWYAAGDSTKRTELFTISNAPASNGQTVNPVVAGATSFDPGAANFGLYSRWPAFNNRFVYSEDQLNTFTGAIPHHVRVYPYREGGQTVANSYVVAFEEHVSGFDYQDLTFVISNVKDAASVGNVVTLAPDADAYVRNGSYGNTNYGSDTTLQVKTNTSTTVGFVRHTYLKFNLQGVSGDVGTAKLRLYGRVLDMNTPINLSVFGVDNDSWTEAGITWNTAPASQPAAINTVNGITTTPQYYEADITELIKSQLAGDKVVTVLVRDAAPVGHHVSFNSKEHAQFQPQLVISSNTQPQPQPGLNNMLFVENLDRFPANDRFSTSRIQVPWTRDTAEPFRYNANHDTARIRIHNKGVGPLVVNNLVLSNYKDWKYLTLKGSAFDSAATFPLNIAPGTFAELRVQFVAVDASTNRVRVLNDSLTIFSNDDKEPVKKLYLHGLWQREGESFREPDAQTIIRAFGYRTNVGFGGKDPDMGDPSKPKGNEVIASYWVRSDSTKPVYIRQMAAYHGCCTQTETIRWFAKGAHATTTGVVGHIGLDAQSILPRRSLWQNPAEGNFTPNGAFGFKVGAKDFTDTLLNPERRIGIRVWRAIDANNRVIPDAYIFANDYLGSDVTNYDYNDNLYYVSNVRPEALPASTSPLVSTPSSVDFETKALQTSNSFNITLKNNGRVLANGLADPAITITSVVIAGENQSEFSVAQPAKSTLAAQESTTLSVSFNPATEGLKVADLLVYHNNASTPYRIPLYGIGVQQGRSVTVVQRIKSGSLNNVTVNGRTWVSDAPYAFDNLEPYTNPRLTSIAGTDEDVLYLVEQSSNGEKRPFRYEVPVPNGEYHVRLHFAEIYWGTPGGGSGGAGSRVMNISLEGQRKLVNLDVAGEVGSATALVRNTVATVTDGKLNIDFGATANRPMVCAVEILRFDGQAITNNTTPPEILSLPQVPAGQNTLAEPKVYPNPVQEKFWVDFPAGYSGTSTLHIVDQMGNTYEVGRARMRSGGTSVQVNIAPYRFKPGVYFLRISPEGQAEKTVKLVIR